MCSLREKWILEYQSNLGVLNNVANEICDTFKTALKGERIIVTYRVKDPGSLHEKIKRNNLDRDENYGQDIFQVIDDPIGIRIICMKIEDEEFIYNNIIDKISTFKEGKIVF